MAVRRRSGDGGDASGAGPGPTAGLVLAAAALLCVPGGLPADQGAGGEATPGRVLGVRVEARVAEAGPEVAPTEVDIRYRLVADDRIRDVPLQGLAFFGASPSDVRASVGGAPAASEVDAGRAPLVTGAVRLPDPAEPGDTLELELSYRLPAALPTEGGSFDVVLPLLYVDWRPEGAPDDMLQATIVLPSDYSIQESFPTVPREMVDAGATRRYRLGLQAVPSMIRFRGHEGEPPLLTFGRLVDLGVVAGLSLLGLWGWRVLRRERARARTADSGRAGEPAGDGARGEGADGAGGRGGAA